MDRIGFDDLVMEGEEVDRANRTRRFYLKAQKKQERCDHCGALLKEGKVRQYGTRSHNYRDIPIRNDRILLVVEMQRFSCLACNDGKVRKRGRTFVQRIEGLDLKRSMTTRCIEWIRTSCLNYTFRHIANACGCPERTVRDIAYEYIAENNRTYKPYIPEWLGIDEITLDGNIDNCCCVLVDVAQRKPIDVLPNRLLDTVRDWMTSFGKCPQLRGVSMDMYENYRTAVTEAFPGVPIVVDRFHVVRGANKAVDRVRIRLSKKYSDVKKTDEWKKNVGLLRKRWGRIPRDRRPDFLKWLSSWPDLEEVYILKESFCEIYHLAKKEKARSALEEWQVSLPDKLHSAFKEVLTAITDWREELLAFFDRKETNAYTEGFNSVIRNVNNEGRGYTFEVLRGKLLFGAPTPCKTFRIQRAEKELIEYLRNIYRKNGLPRQSELSPSPGNHPEHSYFVPKICMECRRTYDEEDSTQVFVEKYLPPQGSIVCNSCHRPLDPGWMKGVPTRRLDTLRCEFCSEFFHPKQSNFIRIGSSDEVFPLCNGCMNHREQIERDFSVLNDKLSASLAGLTSTNRSSEAIWPNARNADYDTLYRNLEKARLAEGNEPRSRTKRARGYPIIANDLRRVFQGRPLSDPAGRPKRRRKKDDDVQLSLDLVFEDLKIKFKRSKINQEDRHP